MLYKFLDTYDVDKVMVDGTIVVSSLEYFQNLEEGEWADIGDPLEGSTELTAKGDFAIREDSPELTLVNNANIGLGMFKTFAVVSGGGQINISAARFIHQIPNLFIYSVADGDLADLTNRMCVAAKRPYDACLRVLDIEHMRQVIFEHGRICNLACRVDDVFEPGLIGPVLYAPRSRDVRQGPTIEPSPFVKEERFRGQSEVRMLLVPKTGVQVPDGRLIIELPHPTSLFKEVFRR